MFTNKNPFTEKLWSEIKAQVSEGLKKPGPHYAVFDADGTLWPNDAGETFFQYQIAHSDLECGVPDPWKHYWHLKDFDAPASCLWLAQINKGKTLKQVRQWANDCYKNANEFPIHQSMHDLVSWLLQTQVRVYIVTASIKWAVEPGARRLGLKNENVLGIEVTEENGVLTGTGRFPLSFGPGKSEVFNKFTGGVAPLLASGNTNSDLHLIEMASHVSLAVSSAAPGEHNHETEMRMREEAQKRGWLTHSFY